MAELPVIPTCIYLIQWEKDTGRLEVRYELLRLVCCPGHLPGKATDIAQVSGVTIVLALAHRRRDNGDYSGGRVG